MSTTKIVTKKDLRDQGYTIAQISSLTPDTEVKSGGRGRPAFGYKLSTVKATLGASKSKRIGSTGQASNTAQA